MELYINQKTIRQQSNELSKLLIRKNKDYGNSFEEQFHKRGLTGVLIRLEDKMSRLDNLQKNEALVNESIEDTLKDIAGYALLASILINKDTPKEIKRTKSKKVYHNFVAAVEGVRRLGDFDLYQCAYNCECGNGGIRYVKDNQETTKCHKCKNELNIMPSTHNDAHDSEFNYFIAY